LARWKIIKPWLGVVGLVGLGLLPCPDCGTPMILHFWPIALVLTYRNIIKKKYQESNIIHYELKDTDSYDNGVHEIICQNNEHNDSQ
jgi:hypothetical protein